MRRNAALTLALGTTLVLAACGGGEDPMAEGGAPRQEAKDEFGRFRKYAMRDTRNLSWGICFGLPSRAM